MNASWIFKSAVAFSVVVHGGLLVLRTGQSSAFESRVVEIPVVLEAEIEPPPPPPPPEPPQPKPRPRSLPRHIEQVAETDGTRAAELTDADVGEYTSTAETAPAPIAPPVEKPPPPKPQPKTAPPPAPTVDRVKIARQFLGTVRNAIASAKRYPFRAQRMGIAGSVAVSLVIQPSSHFTAVSIRRSSGYDVLDKAALATVRALSGRFPRPAVLGNVPLRTSIVLRYSLDGG